MSDAPEVNKPFECTSPGCKATFTNEDHLSSHQKRHEMSLLLPGGITISRSNSLTLGADLTPTPTRFIRIGEEVGLFQDLLKANPFDEQFRKAAEQNKAAAVVQLPLPFSGSSDEPLNTPHVVHPAEGEPNPQAKGAAAPAVDTPQPRLASPHRLSSPPPAHVIVTPCSPLGPRVRPAHGDDPDDPLIIEDDMEVEGPLDMRSPSVIPPVAETLLSPVQIQTPTTVQSSAVSSTVATPRQPAGPPPLRPRPAAATPEAAPPDAVEFQIKLSNGQVIPLSMTSPTPLTTPPAGPGPGPGPSSVREKLKQTLQRQEKPTASATAAPASQESPTAAGPARDSGLSEDTLRKERNRAAANRWRARKKQAQEQMASSMESLTSSVRQLRRENDELRAEVAKLKLFLIQHRDCDVTRGVRPMAETDVLERLDAREVGRLDVQAVGQLEPEAARPAAVVTASPLPVVLAAPVSAVPVQTAAGATHQLILVSAGAPRPPAPLQPTAGQPTLALRHFRPPRSSGSGRPPPGPHC